MIQIARLTVKVLAVSKGGKFLKK